MTEDFLIGTYTSKSSRGIYGVTLDTEKEELTNVRLVAASGKPAYLQYGEQKRLYALKQDGERGGVASYDLSGDKAELIDAKKDLPLPTLALMTSVTCCSLPITIPVS